MIRLFRRRRKLAGDLGLVLVYGTVPAIGLPMVAAALLLVGLCLILAAEVARPGRVPGAHATHATAVKGGHRP